MRTCALWAFVAALTLPVVAQETGTAAVVAKIRAEGYERSKVLETFDRHVAEVRRGLLQRSDAELLAPWSLTRGGRVVMSMPKLSALRSFLLHHTIHHRGQMTVYLRLQNVPIPPIYGQTADENM